MAITPNAVFLIWMKSPQWGKKYWAVFPPFLCFFKLFLLNRKKNKTLTPRKERKHRSLFWTWTPFNVGHYVITKVYLVSLKASFFPVTNTYRSYKGHTRAHFITLFILFCALFSSPNRLYKLSVILRVFPITCYYKHNGMSILLPYFYMDVKIRLS